MKYSALLAALIAISLTACGGNGDQGPSQVVQQPGTQPAPVAVQQVAPQDNMVRDMLIGGLVGHAISGGSASNTTVHKTVIYQAPRPSYTYRPAPSYRSSFGRSSSFGFRRR